MTSPACAPTGEERQLLIQAEVSRLLGCIAGGSDHYTVLAIKPDAAIDDIRRAYCRAVDLIHPHKCQDLIETDGALRFKLSQAFLRVVEAFCTLSRPGRRVEYDASLRRPPLIPLPLPRVPEEQVAPTRPAPGPTPRDLVPVGTTGALGTVFGGPEPASRVSDRRKGTRYSHQAPVRAVRVDGSWEELTETIDLSLRGAKLRLTHGVAAGMLLRLELPMPEHLRRYSRTGGLYVVNSVVRHQKQLSERAYEVGVEFV